LTAAIKPIKPLTLGKLIRVFSRYNFEKSDILTRRHFELQVSYWEL